MSPTTRQLRRAAEELVPTSQPLFQEPAVARFEARRTEPDFAHDERFGTLDASGRSAMLLELTVGRWNRELSHGCEMVLVRALVNALNSRPDEFSSVSLR